MKTFASRRTKPIQFDLDGEVYEAIPVIPASVLVEMTRASVMRAAARDTPTDTAKELTNDELVDAMDRRFQGLLDTLDRVLTEESRDRLVARLSDKGNGVEWDMLIEIVEWLTEQYAHDAAAESGAPLDASGTSSDGLSPNGTGSSVTASGEASTSEPSPTPTG